MGYSEEVTAWAKAHYETWRAAHAGDASPPPAWEDLPEEQREQRLVHAQAMADAGAA